MPADVICLETYKGERIAELDQRPTLSGGWDVERTAEGVAFTFGGETYALSEREAQAVFRALGVVLGVAR